MAEPQSLKSLPFKDRYDIVIAGGGMVGASLALLLSVRSDQQINILLVENSPLQIDGKHTAATYSPSFDARSTALSYSSRLIFESLNLWPSLERHLAAIESIHVSQRGGLGSALMKKSEVDWPALGYVVENQWLGDSLLSALSQHDNIIFAAPATVKSVIPKQQGSELFIEHSGECSTVVSQLVIVADGANSGLRQQLGVATNTRDYKQRALIANVSVSRPHQGYAFERFTDQGPLALLPLVDGERGEQRAALVWSLPPELAQENIDIDDQEFLSRLQQSFGNRLGEFTRVGARVAYPLRLIEAQEQLRSGVVIMGNAAHSLHPVAGQGFNLALRDCARLTTILCDAYARGESLGELSLLQQYMQQQTTDQQKTIAFSDRLPELFANRQWPLSLLRGLGLGVLDIVPPAKNQFIHNAAGMHDGAAQG